MITERLDIQDSLDPIRRDEARRLLRRRESREDTVWFTGVEERHVEEGNDHIADQLTPNRGAFHVLDDIHGRYYTVPNGSVVAYRRMIVPDDPSRAGIEAFLDDRGMVRDTIPHLDIARVLINEPRSIFRGHDVLDHIVTFESTETHRDLASHAIDIMINDGDRTTIDEAEAAELVARYHEARYNLRELRDEMFMSAIRHAKFM